MSNQEKKSFGDSIFGSILGVIIALVFMFVSYIGWVNSGMNDSSFFGMTFRYPLENKEHYCSRKAQILIVFDTDRYQSCLRED